MTRVEHTEQGDMSMNSRRAEIVRDLRLQLDRHYATWQVDNLHLAAEGLEFAVCRGDSSIYGPLAFRVPWKQGISNENDESISARALLRQEAVLYSHARAFGIASPVARHLHTGDDSFDFLVSEFVVGDGSSPDSHQCGRLLRSIHDIPLPSISLVMQGEEALSDIIAERLLRRSRVVERIVGMDLPLPELDVVRTVLSQSSCKPSLLHMDARPENFLTWKGDIVSVVDWSNALVGSAALELARIGEYGHLNSDFLMGYGRSDATEVPLREEILYRLDTAVMLSVVFLSEAPDAKRAQAQVARVVSLLDAFWTEDSRLVK